MHDLYKHDVKEERCGVVLKDGTIVEGANLHDEPEKGFRLDPMTLLENEDELAGTWHTHPDSDPNLSQEDYAGFLNWPNLSHFIIGLRAGEVVVKEYIVENGLVVAK